MTDRPQLSISGCRARQQRARQSLQAIGAERAIVVSRENVQWLTGFRPHPLMCSVAVLDVDGVCTLIAPNSEPEYHAADEVITYEAQWLSTLRQDQLQAALAAVPRSPRRTAVEFSACGYHVASKLDHSPIDLDPAFWELRRTKDPDEIAMIRHAIRCTDAMYCKAREIIRPGVTELEVYNALHAAAVETAGEPLTGFGNDFQSNSPGGPPRQRQAESGELMILDLGPAYRGYYADNCRTFSVGGNPTDEQLQAREAILAVFDLVRSSVRPGVSAPELYRQAKELLDEHRPGAFFHHLGHGIGLYPHEAPHLNPHWQDTFRAGDVFTVEPGLYWDSLKAGIRIEENYLVTADGVEQLTSTPTDL